MCSHTQENIVNDENINTIYLALKEIPQFYTDILSMIYCFTSGMAETASVMNIPIGRLYQYKREGIRIIEGLILQPSLAKNDKLLSLALEKYETDEIDKIERDISGLQPSPKAEIEAAYEKFQDYIKKHRYNLCKDMLKYKYYKIYKKVRSFFEYKEL